MCGVTRYLGSVLVFSYVYTHDYYEDKQKPLLTAVPKSFDLQGRNAKSQFENYDKLIEKLVKEDNSSVTYKVKVFVMPPLKRNKKLFKKGNSKKYNVPLKKTSMKLSNFEVFQRRVAEESFQNSHKFDTYNVPTSATSKFHHLTTKQPITKYKPILSKLGNYTKIIKPVKTSIITLS